MVDFRKLRDKRQKVARLAAESPEFGERIAARVTLNRQLGRTMPRNDLDAAFLIMEWAHDQLGAGDYKAFCKKPWIDEAHWRTAFDLALEIWERAYLKRQAF